MKNNLSLFVLLALFTFPFTSKAASYKVVGYFADWTGNATNMMNNMNYDALTHINYAFAIPNDANGYMYIGNPNLLKGLVTRAHAAGVKVNISVGGANASGEFRGICANNTYRNRFLDTCVNFIKKYNLDGLDLDWEFPNDATEKTMLEELLRDLRSKFDDAYQSYGKYIELTVATNGTDYYGNTLTYDATAYLDYINIMSYDDSPPHHSTFGYAQSCLGYWSSVRGVASSMLVIGVPFYSRSTGAGYTAYSSISSSDPSGAYNDEDGFFMKNSYNHDYNSMPVLKQKANAVKKTYKAGGMMIWELTQDRTDQYSLLDVIGAEMETYVSVNPVQKEVHEIKSYPNPFTQETYIDLQQLNTQDENVAIEISDMNGKIIYSQIHPSNQFFVFRGDISAGMYFCKISDSNASYNAKLIKE
jgi:chitinase